MRFLFFLHPGGEVRLGWLMWKAWWRESEQWVSCPSWGVSAGSEVGRGWDSVSGTNPVTHPSLCTHLLPHCSHSKFSWIIEGWEFKFHTIWCDHHTSPHIWQAHTWGTESMFSLETLIGNVCSSDFCLVVIISSLFCHVFCAETGQLAGH